MMDDRLGTNWVAPDEGSRLSELHDAAMLSNSVAVQAPLGVYGRLHEMVLQGNSRTNLLLTGRPLQNYDYDRIMSDSLTPIRA